MGQPETFFYKLTKCLYSDTMDEVETHDKNMMVTTVRVRVRVRVRVGVRVRVLLPLLLLLESFSAALFW